jgi:uncharacterized metal-binding protein YceD (DUF177 family)
VTNTLDWTEKTTEIPVGGLDRTRAATPEELSSVAQILNILAVSTLSARYRIVSIAGGAYRLSGSIGADVEQACVVSLEPVKGKVNAAFEVEFWPDVSSEESEEEASILGGSDVELLEHGTIPVGRIVFETLSASLDPYPRREGAEFRWQDPKADEPAASNPFAALAKLKDKE